MSRVFRNGTEVIYTTQVTVVTFVCFLLRDAMHKRGLCRHAVSVWLSVRHVRVDHLKTNKHIFAIFSPSVATPL